MVERWYLLFSGKLYSQRFAKGELLTAAEQASLETNIDLWRERLMEIELHVKAIPRHKSIVHRFLRYSLFPPQPIKCFLVHMLGLEVDAIG